jgi:acyl-CoA thioester hydrolase
MREIGCTYADLEEKDGISFPVVEAGARYRAPARYDEVLEVTTRLVGAHGARVRFEYTVSRAADGSEVATGFTEHASIGRSGKPVRLPSEIKSRLTGQRGRA